MTEARRWGPAGSDWEDIGPRLRRAVIDGKKMTVTRYSFGPGGKFPRHVHEQEQMAYVLVGELVFTFDEDPVLLHSGEMILIPSSVPHDAEAGADGAEVLSVVAPSRAGGPPITMLEGGLDGDPDIS